MSKEIIVNNKNWKDIDKLSKFQNLWHIDLSNNLIECVRGLGEFVCLGSLDLSSNKLSWLALGSIKHLFVVDLRLHSNPSLDFDNHYRHHVVDIFPRAFNLDCQFICAYERVSTGIFFDKTNFDKFPIRRHIKKNLFRPTSCKSLRYYGKFCPDAYDFLRQFPDNMPLTEEWDKKKIRYITQCAIDRVHSTGGNYEWIITFMKKLIARKDDLSNVTELYMISTLFIASIEFNISTEIIQRTMEENKISIINTGQCDSFNTLPSEMKIIVISAFLANLSIANTKPKIQKEFVEELYHAMNNLVWVHIRQGSLENIDRLFSKYKNEDLKTKYWLSRSVLAAEAFMLISNVEDVLEDTQRDGLNELIDDATGHMKFTNTLSIYNELIGKEEVLDIVISEIRKNIHGMLSSYNLQFSEKSTELKKNRQVSAKFAQRVAGATNNLCRGQSDMSILSKTINENNNYKKMEIGDRVLLDSQVIATVLAIPESKSALVQVTASPVMCTRGSIKKVVTKNLMNIDIGSFEWNYENYCWIPEDSTGDRIFMYKKSCSDESKPYKDSSSKRSSIEITKIQLYKEGVLDDTCDTDRDDNQTKKCSEETRIYSSSRNSSPKISPRIRRLVTPNPAEICFSPSKTCLTVRSISPSTYTRLPTFQQKSRDTSERIPVQTDTAMWLGDGDYVYKNVWWHSGNPNNVKKRFHVPGWVNTM